MIHLWNLYIFQYLYKGDALFFIILCSNLLLGLDFGLLFGTSVRILLELIILLTMSYVFIGRWLFLNLLSLEISLVHYNFSKNITYILHWSPPISYAHLCSILCIRVNSKKSTISEFSTHLLKYKWIFTDKIYLDQYKVILFIFQSWVKNYLYN